MRSWPALHSGYYLMERKGEMKRLTKAEEEIMQIIWKIGPCTVSEIRAYIEQELGLPRPPHSTISTIVRGLDNQEKGKGFLGFKAYGRTYLYHTLVSKEMYSKQTLRKFVSEYFEGSMNRLVSFMVQEADLSLQDLTALLQDLEEDENE